jgi:hypothetical protein
MRKAEARKVTQPTAIAETLERIANRPPRLMPDAGSNCLTPACVHYRKVGQMISERRFHSALC